MSTSEDVKISIKQGYKPVFEVFRYEIFDK